MKPFSRRHPTLSDRSSTDFYSLRDVAVGKFPVASDLGAHREFWVGVAFLAFLQLTASVLNLMPIPGVDGGNVIYPWLSPQWRRGFDHMAPYGMLLLFALLWNPRVNQVFFGAVFWLGDLLGLPQWLYIEGFDIVRFWS